MKHAVIIIFTILNGMACYAQFNTICDTRSCPIVKKQKCCPIEHSDTLKDSLSTVTDTIPVSADSINEGYEYLVEQYLSVAYPLKEIRINSKFGMRFHPIFHKKMMHNGVDLHARHEDVVSMFPGKVIRVGYDNRSGKYVTVKSSEYTISYCHLSQQYVKVDEFVRAGDALGMSGSTGASTGEHLHLTTKKDGKAINPVILLDYVRKVKDRCIKLLHLR